MLDMFPGMILREKSIHFRSLEVVEKAYFHMFFDKNLKWQSEYQQEKGVGECWNMGRVGGEDLSWNTYFVWRDLTDTKV